MPVVRRSCYVDVHLQTHRGKTTYTCSFNVSCSFAADISFTYPPPSTTNGAVTVRHCPLDAAGSSSLHRISSQYVRGLRSICCIVLTTVSHSSGLARSLPLVVWALVGSRSRVRTLPSVSYVSRRPLHVGMFAATQHAVRSIYIRR